LGGNGTGVIAGATLADAAVEAAGAWLAGNGDADALQAPTTRATTTSNPSARGFVAPSVLRLLFMIHVSCNGRLQRPIHIGVCVV